MSDAAAPSPVPLQAPGAGLPPVEAWVNRHVLFPLATLLLPWDKAMARFESEGRAILQMVEPLPPETLMKPVLINRIAGIEDSSRFWSPAMVLEHLIIVGQRIFGGIVLLSHGRKPDGKADTASVKPKGAQGPEIIETFRAFLEEFRTGIAEQTGDRASAATFEHPWFGELTAAKWVVLAAIHQTIHRRQLEKILGR